MTPTQIPQGGWGPGSTEPTQTCFFYYYSVTMFQQRMLFGPCYLGSKGLQHAKEIGPAKGKVSWELQMFEKANFGQSFLLFFDGPAKNQQAYVSERCPKTL